MQAASILITGASSGIGASLARSLAGPGRTLALVGRDAARLEAVAAACRTKGAGCRTAAIDVLDHEPLADFIGKLDREHPIDLLFSNAGVMLGRRPHETVEHADDAQLVLRTNLVAAIDVVNIVLPAMRRRRRGQIVLTASIAGLFPLADAPAYSASKAGLAAYGLALRQAVAGEGIGVSVVCPGYVTTPLIAGHRGWRFGEVSAEVAAQRILRSIGKNRGLSGFPLSLYWLARSSLMAPEALRRLANRIFRFHLGEARR